EVRVVPFLAERALEVARHQHPNFGGRIAEYASAVGEIGDAVVRRGGGGVGGRGGLARSVRAVVAGRGVGVRAGGDERYRRDAQEYGWHARKATVRRRRSQTLAPPTVPGSFTGEPAATPASRHGLDGMGHMSCTPGRRAAPSGCTSALPDHVRTHMSISFGWYQEGGPTMLLIALVAAAGLIVLAERVYVIVLRSKNNGRPFIERTIQLVRAGKVDD